MELNLRNVNMISLLNETRNNESDYEKTELCFA